MIRISRFSDLASFAEAVAQAVSNCTAAILDHRRRCVLAVPGGSTARLVVPELARRPLAWTRITATLVDERWVPLDHPGSNEGLVRALFVGPAAAATIVGLYDSSLQADAAASHLARGIPLPDVVLLGMGADGHIASLFPGDPANGAGQPLVAVRRPDHVRLTLTPPALLAAEARILAFAGPAKAAAFERAMTDGPPEEMPVRHVLRAGAQVFIGP